MFDVIDMENALGDIDCTVEGDMICLSTDNKSSLTKVSNEPQQRSSEVGYL